MKIGSLFSGIGGFELGLEWAGLGETVWQVEQDAYCREELAKQWPHVRRYERVEDVGKKNLEAVDLICGGFPCQDVSSAGKRAGLGGARSGLWAQFARIASELQPEWLVVENVASGAKNWVDAVRRDLGRRGYASLPVQIAARDVGAPHRRARVFIIGRKDVADGRGHRSSIERSRDDARQPEEQDETRDQPHGRHARVACVFPPLRTDFEGWDRYLREGGPQPGVLPGSDGLSRGVARRRIAALGNAVVPQNAEVIGWIIRKVKEEHDETIIHEVPAHARSDRAQAASRRTSSRGARNAARSVRGSGTVPVDQRGQEKDIHMASPREGQRHQRDRSPVRSRSKRRDAAGATGGEDAQSAGKSQEAVTAAVARPFVKWVGGKGALVDELLPRLPERIGTYYEPFLGGGAVFFTLAVEGRFKRARLNDANMSLIYVYEMITAHVDGLIERLHAHAKRHCESYYYEVRSQDPLRMNVLDQAARFLYLNRTCFNGLYRVNKKGEFNVPFGKYKNPTICDEKNLRAVSMLLKATKARITSQDFEKAVQGAKDGDTVYFDPPYVPASETSNFTAFTKGGFGLAEQIRLRDCFKTLDERGVHVLLSNSDTHLVRELYKGFRLTEVKAPRRVNSRGDKRGDVGELLISGGA